MAAEMALVYPAHIIIDHAGLFGHHHEQGDNHRHEDQYEEDICLFCLKMGSMEHSEALFAELPLSESDGFSDFNQSLQIGNKLLFQARAPPFTLLLNE
jgi:hypothetical protein